VLGQIRRLGKRFVTVGTLERFFPIVGALMDRERACNSECFVASGKIALVRFFLGMPSHVLLQRSSLGEVLLAHLSHKWSVTGVTL